MRARRVLRGTALVGCLLLFGALTVPGPSGANAPAQIDAAVDAALTRFDQQINGGAKFIADSHGVLVFPHVVKAAFLYGVQYGEGALRVNGKTFAYYSFQGTWGASTAVLAKDIIFVFHDARPLTRFETSAGWVLGTDVTVPLLKVAAGQNLATMHVTDPVVAFVLGPRGLMYDSALNGAKIQLLNK
jgi:lipid-binding SYLF domain-containing protein